MRRNCLFCYYSDKCPYSHVCEYFFPINEEYEDAEIESMIEQRRAEFVAEWLEYTSGEAGTSSDFGLKWY